MYFFFTMSCRFFIAFVASQLSNEIYAQIFHTGCKSLAR